MIHSQGKKKKLTETDCIKAEALLPQQKKNNNKNIEIIKQNF